MRERKIKTWEDENNYMRISSVKITKNFSESSNLNFKHIFAKN